MVLHSMSKNLTGILKHSLFRDSYSPFLRGWGLELNSPAQMGDLGGKTTLRNILILIIFLTFTSINLCRALPAGPFPDAVFSKNIKTVQFYKEGWEFSYPIIDLNDDKSLLFSGIVNDG